MTTKGSQQSLTFLHQRLENSKTSGGSQTTIQTKSQATREFNSPKNKILQEHEKINNIHKLNSMLKEQNRALKRELNLMKSEKFEAMNEQKQRVGETNDLRETIKKETGLIEEMKTKIQVLVKQCEMYEDIIEKMEEKISRVNEKNVQLEKQVQKLKLKESFKSNGVFALRKTCESQSILSLNNKVSQVMGKYETLEEIFKGSEEEWDNLKKQWSKEKLYYMKRINYLEESLGIYPNKGINGREALSNYH